MGGDERRRPKRWALWGLGVWVVVVASTGVTSAATYETEAEGCAVGDDPAPDILQCLAGSTAFVRTPTGTGTGLVYEATDGETYLISNAHVVQPHDRVDVVLDEVTTEDVPLVGLDQLADIAVLGPLDVEAPAITFGPTDALVQGEKLFLVGYPGETEDVPTPTIAQGILSRTRAENPFGLTLLQTDASIGGGQSGGALVDADGMVIGVSSLRFAEAFALAISTEDVIASIEAIIKDPPKVATWPVEGDRSSASIELGLFADRIAIPIADDDRTIEFDTGGTTVAVEATAWSGESKGVNDHGLRLVESSAAEFGGGATASQILGYRGGGAITTVDDTHFSVSVPAGELVFLQFLPVDDSFTAVLTASEDFTRHPVIEDFERIDVGETIEGTNDLLGPLDSYTFDLEEGQEVRIEVRSPASDMGVDIYIPNLAFDDPDSVVVFDDAAGDDGGLYGLDVAEDFTAPETGEYEMLVYSFDSNGTAYTLELVDIS